MIWITRDAQAARIAAHVVVPPWWDRLLVALDTLAFYLWKLVLPLGLGIDYGRKPEVVLAGGARFIVAIVPLAVLAGLALHNQRRAWLTAAAIYAAVILPVSGLVPFIAQDVSTVGDRFVYLAMLGPSLALAWLMTLPYGRPWRLEAGMVLVVLAALSVFYSGFWHDQRTVFERGLAVNSSSATALSYVAEADFREGKLARAEELFRRATEVTPHEADAWSNLGAFFANTGRPAEAAEAFRHAVGVARSDDTSIRLNLAMLELQQGESERVVQEMQLLLARQPSLDAARHYRALALFQLARYKEAAAEWESLRAKWPNNADYWVLLGETYTKLGDLMRARECFRRALTLRPGDERATNSLEKLVEP